MMIFIVFHIFFIYLSSRSYKLFFWG